MDYALLKRIIEFNIEDKAGGKHSGDEQKGTVCSPIFFGIADQMFESQTRSMYNIVKVKVS
ncbi:hypothetical protein, partial [Salinicoccus roseus]|uniref:hypothetical protein n=1 Tax=Salinicoccus roseus TaxID=45670 RepID=UPI00223A698B